MRIRTGLGNIRLGGKILLVLCSVIAAMTTVAALVAYNGVTGLTRQAGNERIAEEVLVVQARIAAANEQIMSDTKYLAQNLAFNQAVVTRDLSTLQTSLLLNESTFTSGIDHILVVDKDGNPLVKLADRRVVQVTESDLNDLLSDALLGISVSGVLEGEHPVLAAAAPIQTNSGEIVGAVQIGRKLNDGFLQSINFARPGIHLVLLDRHGEVIASYIEALYEPQGDVQGLLGSVESPANVSPNAKLAEYGVDLDQSGVERSLLGEVVYQPDFIHSADGGPLIVAYVPYAINYEIEGVLAILVDLHTLDSFKDNLIAEQIVALAVIGLLSVSVLTIWAWRTIANPIVELQSATIRLAEGDYSYRAKHRSGDEIGRLAMAFNGMADKLLDRDRRIVAESAERSRAEEALRASRDELEQRVVERTHELQVINDQLHTELGLREQAEQQIRTALQEKEVLLKEIHHRVKNNMQVMSSLLRLQSNYTNEAQTIEVLRESEHRVRSMALVHERLYQSSDLSGIPISDYVHDLVRHLAESYRSNNHRIVLDIQVDDFTLDLDTAIPCGLILNELVSNAFKHAFPDGRNGEIHIELRGHNNKLATLLVRDDGVGIPEDVDTHQVKTLGLQLVTSLSKQVGGSVEFRSDHGTTVWLHISQ